MTRLKRAAFDTENGFSVLGGLAADDPEWIIAQARQVVSHDPMKAALSSSEISLESNHVSGL
jgi:hypothetical protein